MNSDKNKKLPTTNQVEKLDPKKSKEESTDTKTTDKTKDNSNKDKKGCC
jgi:hypothetical protein